MYRLEAESGEAHLVERGGIPEIQAVCVVSKARAKRGKLDVQDEGAGSAGGAERTGLAAKAIRRLQGELGWVAGSEYKLVVDLGRVIKT